MRVASHPRVLALTQMSSFCPGHMTLVHRPWSCFFFSFSKKNSCLSFLLIRTRCTSSSFFVTQLCLSGLFRVLIFCPSSYSPVPRSLSLSAEWPGFYCSMKKGLAALSLWARPHSSSDHLSSSPSVDWTWFCLDWSDTVWWKRTGFQKVQCTLTSLY